MKKLISVLIAFLLVSGQICYANSVSFQGLGPTPGTDPNNRALNISADGTTVVGDTAIWYPNSEAFRWTKDNGMVIIVPAYSYAEAVSGDGSVIVGSRGGYGTTGFIWTEAGGVQDIGDLPGGTVFSLARDISDDGRYVVGVSYADSGGCAYRWSQETGMISLGNHSAAHGTSADGSVVVGIAYGSAFMWTESGGMRDLGHMPIDDISSTRAMAVSADGSTVVGYTHCNSGKRGSFRWTEETGMVDLGCVPGEEYYSEPSDVSADGSIIVGGARYNGRDSAMIWSESLGMRNLLDLLENDYGLDLSGWHLQHATGISNDGLTIVGYGRNPQGFFESWIVTFPKPANTAPIAVAGPNQIAYAWIDGFADVNLDGSGSYDDDNDVLDYYWFWTIDGNDYEANGVSPPTISLPVGTHTIELIVDDGFAESQPNYCTIEVIAPLQARLFCIPYTLYQKTYYRSRGRLLALITMPPGIHKADIDLTEPLVFYPGQTESRYQSAFEFGRRWYRRTYVWARFDKSACAEYLDPGFNKVDVVGKLTSSRYYDAAGYLRLVPWRWHHSRR